MRILIIIAALAVTGLCQAGEIYKWRDKYGNLHYSDVEPATQTAQREVVKSSGPKPMSEAEAKKTADCRLARNNLATLNNSETVQMDLNNDGVAEELSNEQRAQQSKAMQALVTANCSQ